MEKQVAIAVKDLCIGYQEKKQFKDLTKAFSFQVKEGELVAIVGANGIGKSTLLKTLSNENPYRGSVKIFSKEIDTITSPNLAKYLSSVGTNYQIQSYTRVEDVIAKGRSVHTNWIGRYGKKDLEIIKESAKKVGVENLLQRFYNTLSDGEKQRTLIAMSLAQQSNIILLDEPTAFIDYPNKYFITALLKEITIKENKTVLFSSHDLEVVLTYADKILLFSETEVEFLNKKDFLEEEQILKLFNHHQLTKEFQNTLVKQLLEFYR